MLSLMKTFDVLRDLSVPPLLEQEALEAFASCVPYTSNGNPSSSSEEYSSSCGRCSFSDDESNSGGGSSSHCGGCSSFLVAV